MPDSLGTVKEEEEYPDGSFSCVLCRKVFGYQVKLVDNLVELHQQVHVARFFTHLFSDGQIRGAFYEFCRREWAMSQFIKLAEKE